MKKEGKGKRTKEIEREKEGSGWSKKAEEEEMRKG